MTTGLAIVLAAAGACCFAVAAWLQQTAVRTATGGDALRRAGWVRMVHAPRWVGGVGLAAAGGGLHVVALSLAPLVVVQPIGVLAIGLTTVLATRSGGGRLRRPTGVAVAESMLGVGLFVIIAAGATSTPPAAQGAEVRACLLAGGLVAALGTVGALTRARVRCLAFAAAAGVAFGLVAVLVHTAATRVQAGGFGQLPPLAVAGVVAAVGAGGWCVQHAYASGTPQVVVACQAVVDPMLGVGIGIGLLGEGARLTSGAAVGLVACAVLAVTGVIALARHPVAPTDTCAALRRPMTSTSATPVGQGGPSRLRIVIGADTFPPDINGASRFAARLASGLARRGHDVHVLCPATSARSATQTTAGVTVHRVASRRTPWHPTFRICPPWLAFPAASALLDELAPDLVHVQAHFLLGRALVRTAACRRIPLVATNHFMPQNLVGHARVPARMHTMAARLGWRDLRHVFSAAHALTAPTPRAVQLLTDNGLPGAIAVSCGIDLDHFGARPTPHGRRPDAGACRRVLFVGRLDEEKRVDELLRAAARLHPTLEVRWEIVGDGSRRRAWQDLAAQLGIAERVRFHGFVDEDTLREAYHRCDVFCMPGVAELQSLATMEAMAAGAPIVAANAMALPHLVHTGVNGWLYPPGDIPALAECLRRLLTDPEALSRMGQASRRIIAEHTMDRTLDDFESIYRRVLGDQPSTAGPTSPSRRPVVGTPA